jgi:hypothetical protein
MKTSTIATCISYLMARMTFVCCGIVVRQLAALALMLD